GIYGIEGTHLTNNNPGVTIETPAGASVKAVFDGEVSSVFEIEDVWVVLLRHGKYLTTYSGLAGANVSVGNKVKVGQAIGKAGESGEIDFILMEEKKNLDPELWLRKR
ncbi:MAG TPA: peptidoglycan DD-metalloendopeptidase family protein, partial [Chitinophagaceae bacterium]|nr:peptidoglycan DD-metalloendopeptidase family protein [Chitinophagaceae bacterium]